MKLTLLLGSLLLAGISYADSGSVKYVPGFGAKGNVTLVPVREEAVTSIALVKSSKSGAASACSSCCERADTVKYVPSANGKGGTTLVPTR